MTVSAMMLVNGLVTIGFSPFLIKIYMRDRKQFFLFWGAGFLLYGVNIVIRAFANSGSYPTPALWVAYACYMSGFTLIVTGNGHLIGQTKAWLASSAAIIIIPVAVYLLSGPAALGWAATLSPFILTSASLVFIKRRSPVPLDVFILGWLALFIVNLAVPLSLLSPDIIEALAIIAKTVIFVGMISPKFSLLEDDVKRFLISGLPREYLVEPRGRLTLVNPEGKMRSEEVKWIKEKVAENSANGLKTMLVSLYDLISPLDLDTDGLGRDLYFVRMKPGGSHDIRVFQENVATMSDDPSKFDMYLSDVITYSAERNLRCDIILYTLTWIIHSHGWKRVYPPFLSMASKLKGSQVNVYCFYYPTTHSDNAEIAVFEKIADRVILI
jgi:hypothetical protein